MRHFDVVRLPPLVLAAFLRRSGWRRSTILALAMLLGAASASQAQLTTVPTDLNLCERYRLAFVTSTTLNALSTQIGTYNDFVTEVAESVPQLAALDTTWTAIASTQTVFARDNTGTNPSDGDGVPIYLLNDTRLVNDNADLWDGSLAVNLGVDESADQVVSQVWTGTNADGRGSGVGGSLGGIAEGASIAGDSGVSNASWISSQLRNNLTPLPLYALSDILTVPAPPPSDPLREACLHIRYGAETIVQGPVGFGLSTLPESVTADLMITGFDHTQDIVAGLADVASFTLRYGDGVWTELTSFSLVTDATGEVTTLSYATTAITTPTVVAGVILNGSFSVTFEGTDIASGEDLEYFYAESEQTLILPVAEVPSLGAWGLLLLAIGLAVGGRAFARRAS